MNLETFADEFAALKDRVEQLDHLVSRVPTRLPSQSPGASGMIQCILRSVDTSVGELTIQKIKPADGDTTGLVATAVGPTFTAKPRVGEHISAFDDPGFIRATADPETLDNSDPTTAFWAFVAFMESGVWRVMFVLNTDAVIPVDGFATVASEMQQS